MDDPDQELSNEEYAESYRVFAIEAKALLLNHFADEIDQMNIDVCVEHLASDLLANPYKGFDHKRDIKKLENMKRALISLSNINLSWQANDYLMGYAFEFDRQHKDSRSALSKPTAIDVWSAMDGGHKTLGPAIDRLIKSIETDPAKTSGHSQKNHLGIQAVYVCRNFWNMFKNKKAPPKGLNPASPFGNFLQDYFELMQIEGSVTSSFKAWERAQNPNGEVDT